MSGIEQVQSIMKKFGDNPVSYEGRVTSIAKDIQEHFDCFKTLLVHSTDIRDGLFIALYNDDAKMNVVSEYLDTSKNGILMSPRKETVISFAVNCMYSQALVDAQNLMRMYRNVSLEDVVLAWLIISSSAMMLEILASPCCEQEMLDQKIQDAILKSKIGGDYVYSALEEIAQKDEESRNDNEKFEE